MTHHIAILRGINVSGRRKVPMAELRKLLRDAGIQEVKTYIQSGNILLAAAHQTPNAIANQVQNAIRDHFGFQVPVIIRRQDEMKAILEINPFILQRHEDIARLHVTFLSAVPEAGAWEN